MPLSITESHDVGVSASPRLDVITKAIHRRLILHRIKLHRHRIAIRLSSSAHAPRLLIPCRSTLLLYDRRPIRSKLDQHDAAQVLGDTTVPHIKPLQLIRPRRIRNQRHRRQHHQTQRPHTLTHTRKSSCTAPITGYFFPVLPGVVLASSGAEGFNCPFAFSGVL